MEGQHQAKAKAGVSGVFNLVPAGALQRRRRYVAGRFPVGHPQYHDGEYLLCVDPSSVQSTSRQRESSQAAAQQPPALILSSKQQAASSSTGKQLQGLPRTDAGNNYFVLMKAGRDFSVYPLDTSYTFKPIIRSALQSIDELEAAQKLAAAGDAPDAGVFMPKSMRRAMQREAAAAAADKELKEEALPILKDKVAELAVKYGSNAAGSRENLLDASSEGEQSDDMGALEDDEGWGKRKKAKARGQSRQGSTTAAAGKAGPKSAEDPEDALADDIYAGEEDDLRPVMPTEDVDWEFAEEAADDDLEQGASDEEGLDDDPGYRKQLGLEGDDEEDEAEKAKQEKLAQEAEAAAEAAEAAAKESAAAAAAEGAAADPDEDMLDVDESEFDADDLDKLAEQREREDDASPAIKKRKRSVTPPGAAVAAVAARGATPAGGRRGTTPPTAAVSAAAARSATPPLAAAAAKTTAGRKTPPPGAGRRATPPPAAIAAAASSMSKRKREDTASTGMATSTPAAAVASGGVGSLAPWDWTAEQLDAQGVPTTDGIIQALTQMGPVPTEQLQLLQERLNLAQIGNDGKTLLKKRLLQVAKVGIIDGRKYMVLK